MDKDFFEINTTQVVLLAGAIVLLWIIYLFRTGGLV